MSDEAKAVPKTNAPEIIYLQDGNPDDPDSEPLSDYEGVTWCSDWIEFGDTKYIRFDVHEKMQQELELMKTAGIIEVAVRNPSVSEYMKHWEQRALVAEQNLIETRQAFAKVVRAVKKVRGYDNWPTHSGSFVDFVVAEIGDLK